jgi:4-hydroxybenzoate polyprenyltransferase
VLFGPRGGRVRWGDLLLITVAMVAARTFAMAANRVIDRQLDARNPRTANRELVTGAITTRTAVIGAAAALVVFLGAAALLSPLCLALSPIVLVALAGYPYAKRVTLLCHYVLGLAQALAPVGAFVAVSDRWGSTEFLGGFHSAPLAAAIVLGLAVGLWIAGFDVIYACQDIDSDRAEGVHSIPARFGAAVALPRRTSSPSRCWLSSGSSPTSAGSGTPASASPRAHSSTSTRSSKPTTCRG